MVKSKTNKIHLEVKNDVELDVVNDSISKRNRLVEKKRSVPSKRRNASKLQSKVSFNSLKKPKMTVAKASKSKTRMTIKHKKCV